MSSPTESGIFKNASDVVEGPDIMNDPMFNPRNKGKEKDGEDVDTCRICRGEGSQEEPLFYPCKCSGSIKYVHQNCLMEWLAHSQKKHCELCKTPFRFTKLYHPQMPSTVPIPVFLRQAALHGWASFRIWTRFQMVFFVWVFWLPWCMRTIWRGLFWLGDGAWVDWNNNDIQSAMTNRTSISSILSGGSNSSNLHFLGTRKTAASAFMNFFGSKISRMINSNPWRQEPLSLRLAKEFHKLISSRNSTQDIVFPDAANATSVVDAVPRSSTFLSDIPFFNKLTRSTTINNLIIDTLEGQLITLFIVVSFILIFLIREWVMQQQQNMLLGPEGQNEEARRVNLDAPAQQQGGQGLIEQNPADAAPGDNARPRLFVRPRRRVNRPLPQVLAERAENQLPQPAEEVLEPEQSSPLGVRELSSNRVGGFRPLLPPKRSENGELVSPPRVLEDLLQESGRFRDILARAREDPTLDIMTIMDEEIKSTETDTILKRLGTPEAVEYLKAVYSDSTSLSSEGRSDEEVANQAGIEEAQRAESNEDFKISPKPRSEDGSKPHQTLQDSYNVANNTHEDVTSLQITKDHQGVQNAAAQDDIRTGTKAHNLSSGTTEVNSWTWDKDKQELVGLKHDPPESSGRPSSQSNGRADKEGLIDESQMLERLNVIDAADNHVDAGEGEKGSSAALGVDGLPEERLHNPVSRAAPDQGYVEFIKNWLWGDIALPPGPAERPAGDEEHIVHNLAEEEPFVPVVHGQHLLNPPAQEAGRAQDVEVLAAAAQAGIDPNEAEVVDDMEDLEGVMELIGMEGPLAGLMQNGMFCAVLVSLTIFFGVWVPYMSGKIFLTLLARPVSLPLRLVWLASTGADIIVDTIVLSAGGLLYWTDITLNLLCQPIGWGLPVLKPYLDNKIIAQASAGYAERALDRLLHVFLIAGDGFTRFFDLPTFSIIAHESLRQIEAQFQTVLKMIFDACKSSINPLIACSSISEASRFLSMYAFTQIKAVVSNCVAKFFAIPAMTTSVLQMNTMRLNLAGFHRSAPLDVELAAWDGTDRAMAVIAGYIFFAFLGMVYLYVAGAMHGQNKKGVVNGSLAQILYQAGGVMKVILIISIEMIVFPLYCGVLLDIALLPLFGSATFLSRVAFTATSPWTSIFVHWFVGTCYMFHFALFVSMCRKILRTGVLFFIRDPDDPTFHPVRDVLERSVSSQLWKISFSALVYGGLVLVGLGGVVWGIAYAFKGVFPIHWSSDEPVLEFPVDLLFYNFLMPMAVRFFKPSVGLNKIYGWWFRKCARLLRLSSFLFNDTRPDEQGRHIRRNWTDVLQGVQGDLQNPVIGEERKALWDDRGTRAIFFRDGSYVRAPGSDQVRITKGASTFIEVDEDDRRLDGVKDGDEDPYGRKMNLFTKVYIPPFFATRVVGFLSLIWLFAAVTGVSVTVIPLLFGRWIFAKLTPDHLRTNDIYAFSMGIYILGSVAWLILNHRRITKYLSDTMAPHTTSLKSATQKAKRIILRVLSLLYIYSAVGIVLPCLFSLVIEFYLIIPLQTYFVQDAENKDGLTTSIDNAASNITSYPVIHIIQDWTLGVLYIKTLTRLILWTEPSRPALALRAIVAQGWLNPNIRLATRGFIFPASLVMFAALTAPLPLGWVVNQTMLHARNSNSSSIIIIKSNENTQIGNTISPATVYRYSYPAVLAFGIALVLCWMLSRLFEGWRRKVRDEVYLIGERLHNFGEGAKAGAMSRVRVGKLAVGRAAAAATE